MTLKNLLEIVKEDTPITIEVHNQSGYEGTWEFNLTDLNLINPEWARSKVIQVEIFKKRLHITIKTPMRYGE